MTLVTSTLEAWLNNLEAVSEVALILVIFYLALLFAVEKTTKSTEMSENFLVFFMSTL